MNAASPLYLSATDVCRALPMGDAIEAMRDAFSQLSSGQVTLSPRQHLNAVNDQGVTLTMPCYSPSLNLFSLKQATVFHGNADRGLPIVQSIVLLTDGTTGTLLALMEGASLTAIRTGAASGLATDLLARPDSAVVAILGAGVQARTQLEAVCRVRPIRHARVFSRTSEKGIAFAREMSQRLGIPVEAVASSSAAIHGADVICTATSSRTAVFDDANVSPGTHINAIGAYLPEMVEIPEATVCRAKIAIDHRQSAMQEAGDLLTPLRAGMISESDFQIELGDIVLGRSNGRTRDDEITLFKSVGIAIQDLCAAARAFEMANRLGIGTRLKNS